jgi:hypothetical protein
VGKNEKKFKQIFDWESGSSDTVTAEQMQKPEFTFQYQQKEIKFKKLEY